MQQVSCVVCGSDSFAIVYPSTLGGSVSLSMADVRCTSDAYGRHAQIVQCLRCKHRYSNPRWSSGELIEAYAAVEDQTYVREEEGREITFERRLAEMERVTGEAQGRSLLDVGAYTGVFVDIARRAGWDATGVELSQWCVERAQEKGIPLIHGGLDAPELREKQFDVVTLWDVLEHMHDPRAEIRRAAGLLKPGGIIVLHTMDVASPCARLMGARWPWYLGMHLHFFSKRNLCRLLGEVGFAVMRAGASGRYLRLGYFASSLASLLPFPGKLVSRSVGFLQLGNIPVRLNFGDLITVYGRKGGETGDI